MNNNKFVYFLNAVYYHIDLWQKGVDGKAAILRSKILRLCKERIRLNFEANIKSSEKMSETVSQAETNFLFGTFYSYYPLVIELIIGAFYIRGNGSIHSLWAMILLSSPIVIAYIPAYKAIFSEGRYLEYRKIFSKESDNWHRKWKKRTIVFVCGAIISFFLGIALALVILFILPDSSL